jgi:phosphoribosylformimino-5-aminoimidazole carboxamide ribonucleotide (ProFAR) isomerase
MLLHLPEPDRLNRLNSLIELLVEEAGRIPDGVPAIWHPEITSELVAEVTDRPVISIRAESAEQAISVWKESQKER